MWKRMWRRMRRKRRRRREEEDEKENNGGVGLTNFFFKSPNMISNDFHAILYTGLLRGSPSLPQLHWKSGSLFLNWYIQSLELPFFPRLFSNAQR